MSKHSHASRKTTWEHPKLKKKYKVPPSEWAQAMSSTVTETFNVQMQTCPTDGKDIRTRKGNSYLWSTFQCTVWVYAHVYWGRHDLWCDIHIWALFSLCIAVTLQRHVHTLTQDYCSQLRLLSLRSTFCVRLYCWNTGWMKWMHTCVSHTCMYSWCTWMGVCTFVVVCLYSICICGCIRVYHTPACTYVVSACACVLLLWYICVYMYFYYGVLMCVCTWNSVAVGISVRWYVKFHIG